MNAATVILIIAYAMPGRLPDIQLEMYEPTLALCWQDAGEFLNHGMPDIVRDKGAVALYAGCKVSADHTVRE